MLHDSKRELLPQPLLRKPVAATGGTANNAVISSGKPRSDNHRATRSFQHGWATERWRVMAGRPTSGQHNRTRHGHGCHEMLQERAGQILLSTHCSRSLGSRPPPEQFACRLLWLWLWRRALVRVKKPLYIVCVTLGKSRRWPKTGLPNKGEAMETRREGDPKAHHVGRKQRGGEMRTTVGKSSVAYAHTRAGPAPLHPNVLVAGSPINIDQAKRS